MSCLLNWNTFKCWIVRSAGLALLVVRCPLITQYVAAGFGWWITVTCGHLQIILWLGCVVLFNRLMRYGRPYETVRVRFIFHFYLVVTVFPETVSRIMTAFVGGWKYGTYRFMDRRRCVGVVEKFHTPLLIFLWYVFYAASDACFYSFYVSSCVVSNYIFRATFVIKRCLVDNDMGYF